MEKYKSNLAFVDILFQLLTVLTVLWWMSTLLIHDPGKKEIDTVAQVLVTLNWSPRVNSDMDLWVMDPGGRVEGYQNTAQGAGFMSLERDDLGDENDVYTLNGKHFAVSENSEVITIRKLVPGEYKVSVHYYSKPRPNGVSVEVRVIQVNPTFQVKYAKRVRIDNVKDEMAMFRFYVDENGKIVRIEEEPAAHFLIGTRFQTGRKVYKPNEAERDFNTTTYRSPVDP